MSTERPKRRSRYKRAVERPVKGVYQHPGDTDILTLVHDYRYLTRPLLELLAGREGTSLKRRLRFLYDHSYLGKVHFSRAYRETGSAADIYVLDEQGREEYQRWSGLTAEPSPLRNKNKDPQLEHTLLINTVRAIVTAACEESGDITLVEWHRDGKDSREKVTLDDGTVKTVAPDALFILRRESDRKIMPFMLEADRTTMPTGDMVQKYATYYAHYRAMRAQLDAQKGRADKEVTNRFGIQGFRVLTVVEQEDDWQQSRNRDRLAALMEAGLRAVKNGAGWRGFWFTTKGQLDLAKPESIFAPVWRVAYKGETETLRSIVE